MDLEIESETASGDLCHVCSLINFKSLYGREIKIYALGTLQTVARKTACPTCRLFTRGVERAWSVTSTWIASQERPIRGWIRNVFWAQHCSEATEELMPRVPETQHHRVLLGTDWKPGHRTQGYGEDLVRYTVTEIDIVDTSHEYLFLGTKDNCLERLFRRRPVRDQFDIGLLRAWISECRHNHSHSTFHQNLKPQSLRNARFRVIDVVENRLIEPSVACRYVALSYVWGTSRTHQWVCQNVNLDDRIIRVDKLPRTIKDAILLTRLLGERYLWVDLICIEQNNAADKAGLIRHMGIIYESACFTIVAAAGNDADHGLPGLHPESRPSETITTIGNGSEALRLALSKPSLHSLVENSHWNTRGWTYQEHVLSQNCLFFTDDEVFYSCPDNLSVSPTKRPGVWFIAFNDARFSNWREAYSLETRGLRTTYQSEIPWGNAWDRTADPLVGRILDAGKIEDHGDTGFLGKGGFLSMSASSGYLQYVERSIKGGDLRFLQYVELVKEYSHRRLTNGGDIVDAFAGILSKLWSDQELGTALDHGIPLEYLELGLLWSSVDQAHFARRGSQTANDLDFPSWSWAGWEGHIAYYPVSKADPDWSDRRSYIQDYSAWRFMPEWYKRPKVEFLALSPFLWFQITEENAIVGQVRDNDLSSPPPGLSLRRNALVLWTTCLHIGTASNALSQIKEQVGSVGGEVYIDSAATCNVHDLHISPKASSHWELVAIALGRARYSNEYVEEYVALLVRTEGIWSERVGIARFPKTTWDSHGSKQETKWVSLR